MAPIRKDDNEKENQGIQTIVENIIEQIVPDLIERILAKTGARTNSTEEGITKKAAQFLKIVGNFDGIKDGYDFLCTAEAMFITMGIQDQDKTTYVCCTFVSSAARWLLNNEEYRKLNWQEFRSQFERQFCTKNSGQTDLMRFMKLKKNGSMEEHINKCAQLRRGIPKEIPEKELILIFLHTLEDEEQAILATMDPSTLDDAFLKAMRFSTFRPDPKQSNCLAARTHNNWQTSTDTNRQYSNAPERHRRPLYDTHRGSHRNNQLASIWSAKCYNCGGYGHLAKTCRERSNPQNGRWNTNHNKNRQYREQPNQTESYRSRVLYQNGEPKPAHQYSSRAPIPEDQLTPDFPERSH